MSPLELGLIALAGLGAGFINAVAGSGTLITFPTLIALGVPPVTANVSNNVGLIPGSVAGSWGFRRELAGQRGRAVRLATASAVGGTTGAVLLLALPSSAFDFIVPGLVGLGLVLVATGPMVNRRVARVAEARGEVPGERGDARWLWPAVASGGVYGGYFGAAQGIILVAALGVGTAESLHRVNALKNVLASVANTVAAVVFVAAADVDWLVALLIGVGSVVGATLGARAGRRLSPALLRGVILLVGTTALVVFLVRG